MRNLTIITFVLLSIQSFSQTQNNSILIEGEKERVEMLTDISVRYLAGKGKIASFTKSYDKKYNDPSGKTMPKSNGTWVKVASITTGDTKIIQISEDMLAKMKNHLTNATGEIASAMLVEQLCAVQSTDLKFILDMVTNVAPKEEKEDCGCIEKTIILKEEPSKVQLSANDFETPAIVDACSLAKTELARLETIYKYGDRKTIQANGFKNKKTIEQAMIDLAIANPNCPDLNLKIQKRNNTWVWIAGGVATVLLADVIEGNGIDGFGLFDKKSNEIKKIVHTEPIQNNSGNSSTGTINHTGTSNANRILVPTNTAVKTNSGFGSISSSRR